MCKCLGWDYPLTRNVEEAVSEEACIYSREEQMT